jgi:transcriptional regulator with XRE-family HTH domain
MAQAAEQAWVAQTPGERMLLIRSRLGLTQIEVARRVSETGVKLDHSTLSQFESGRRKPAFGVAWAIAKVYGVKVRDLGYTEEDYPELAFYQDPAMLNHIERKMAKGREQRTLSAVP